MAVTNEESQDWSQGPQQKTEQKPGKESRSDGIPWLQVETVHTRANITPQRCKLEDLSAMTEKWESVRKYDERKDEEGE